MPTPRSRYAVFLPVRNGADYIRDAIDSVVAQTRQDWVLLILDNASTDATREIAGSYDDPRITLRTSSDSLPIWESWHRIWTALADKSVDAEYATTIGHDDRLAPKFLETIDALIDGHPEASLYQTGFDLIDEKGRTIRPCRPVPTVESSADFIAARLWGLRDSVGTGYVFRPADYVVVGGIPKMPLLLHADDLLFARLARLRFKAASRDSACFYRLHRGSASHRLATTRIEGQVAAVEDYVQVLQAEFADFLKGDAGKAALACFLAREIVLLRPLARPFFLAAKTCARIEALESLYRSVAAGVDYRRWLGTNLVSQRVYPYAKQALLGYVLLRDKLGRGRGGSR